MQEVLDHIERIPVERLAEQKELFNRSLDKSIRKKHDQVIPKPSAIPFLKWSFEKFREKQKALWRAAYKKWGSRLSRSPGGDPKKPAPRKRKRVFLPKPQRKSRVSNKQSPSEMPAKKKPALWSERSHNSFGFSKRTFARSKNKRQVKVTAKLR